MSAIVNVNRDSPVGGIADINRPLPNKLPSPFRHEGFSQSSAVGSFTMLRHLFPSFDGPVRASPYFCTPRRQSWWPVAVAFGAGMACVSIVILSWKEADRSAEQTAIHWTTLPADAADATPQTMSAAPAVENQQANAGPSTPVEVQTADHAPAQPETPVPTRSEEHTSELQSLRHSLFPYTTLFRSLSWKEADRSAEQTAIHWTTLPADAADATPQTMSAAPAVENQQANAGPSTPVEVQTADHAPAQPETPVPT